MHACLQRRKRMRKIKRPVKKRESEMALFFVRVVRLAAHVSNGLKSRIRPVVGRI